MNALLIVTNQAMPKGRSVLKENVDVLKQCADLAQPSAEAFTKNTPDSMQRPKAEESSKSTAETFIINTWLVSCAASRSRFACASPGSVAAYHGALSRLRLGFKSRLGRSFFAF